VTRQKRVNNIIFVAQLIKHKLIQRSLVQLIINNLFKLYEFSNMQTSRDNTEYKKVSKFFDEEKLERV
jgi:hypothetical protein